MPVLASKTRLVRVFPWLCLLAMGLFGSGCAISQDEEIHIGQQSRAQFEKEFGGLYPDRQIQDYVQEVGMNMARYTGRPDLPWQFRVVNSDQINAFALPGGFVYITKGLLFNLNNEAQLAGILGHEAGHVAHRHSVQQLERAQVLQGGALLAGVLGGQGSSVGDIGQIVAGLINLKYSREQEKEADLTGLSYITRAGYQPQAMVQDMEILRRLSTGGQPPEFLSSHPNPENREGYLTEAVQQNLQAGVLAGGRTGRDRFQEIVLSRRDQSPAPRRPPPQ